METVATTSCGTRPSGVRYNRTQVRVGCMAPPNGSSESGDEGSLLFGAVKSTDAAAIEVLDPEDVLGIGYGSGVLIVDDDVNTLVAYEAALSPLGRSLVLVQSGIDALGKLLEQDFALVLLDMSMPGMSGLETARLLRQRPRCKGLPIIFVTGETWSSDVIAEAYEAGASDFILKPVPPEILRAKVSVYLRLQEQTRKLLQQSAELRAAYKEVATAIDGRQTADTRLKRVDEFLAMLGHELRNPLAVISSAVYILNQRETNRELSILDRQVNHLAHIVGALLDVSRITQGKIELHRVTVDLAEAVNESIDAMRSVIDSRAQILTVDVPVSLQVDADRDRLHQVLVNLVSNAATFTPEGGKVEVSAAEEGTCIRLVVRDNGRGMPAALVPDVFDLFVQGERTAARREGGLGIGLTLVRTIVELHGGTVEAHSDGPGAGSTFTVRWPKASSRTPTREMAVSTLPSSETPLRVLIVDDNIDAAELLAEFITTIGHDVKVAYDAMSALEVAKEYAPQVAILDLGLPTIDGYELARRLHVLPRCLHTKLIALTGSGQLGDEERSMRAGFAKHLLKPVALDELRELLSVASVMVT